MKKLSVIIPVLVGMLILSGAVVKYATSDLLQRVTKNEVNIATNQKAIEIKANATEMHMAIHNIDEKVDEIKESNEEVKIKIESLLTELNKIRWRKEKSGP